MKKQLLLIVMLLSTAASAFAVEEVEIDGLWYEVVAKAKEAKVIQHKNNVKYNGDIVIPETVVYEGVTYSVTSIGDYAFWDCSDLTSVTIPNSVTSIGDRAFWDCSGLKKVIVKDIAAWCGISFSDNPLSHSHHLYSDENTEITELIIPNSVTSIGEYAFEYCYGLTSVTIGNCVTSIGDAAFCGCSGLTSVTIPNSVTSIGDYAFQNCSGLTSVAIGGGVKSIRSGAFANCEELTDVTCYAKIIPSTESNVFNDSYIEYATLHVPTGAINAYKATEPWKNFKKIVALTDQELSVDAITNDSNEAVARYTIGGQRANRQTKGLNIVRMSNGTSKKVVAK